jgi:hypothetical protein
VPPTVDAERQVTDAWRGIVADPQVQAAQAAALKAAEEQREIAEKQLTQARAGLAAHEGLSRVQEAARARGYASAGATPEAAQARAAAEATTARAPFADAVRTAETRAAQAAGVVRDTTAGTTGLAADLRSALERGDSAERLGERLGASDELLAGMRRYEDALRQARRIAYPPEN